MIYKYNRQQSFSTSLKNKLNARASFACSRLFANICYNLRRTFCKNQKDLIINICQKFVYKFFLYLYNFFYYVSFLRYNLCSLLDRLFFSKVYSSMLYLNFCSLYKLFLYCEKYLFLIKTSICIRIVFQSFKLEFTARIIVSINIE